MSVVTPARDPLISTATVGDVTIGSSKATHQSTVDPNPDHILCALTSPEDEHRNFLNIRLLIDEYLPDMPSSSELTKLRYAMQRRGGDLDHVLKIMAQIRTAWNMKAVQILGDMIMSEVDAFRVVRDMLAAAEEEYTPGFAQRVVDSLDRASPWAEIEY